MKLCITEKPSVAQDIAKILGATTRRDGYWEGGEYKVTWTYGHLCELKEPADYTERWKRWSLGSLPMLPPRFGIKLKADTGIERQFAVISALIKEAEEVINCGDAGQEGELIQRWVMQKADIKCPVRRLWISSLTDDAIREGFKNLKSSSAYDNLYHAGLSRAIGDWILGMNATRLYSLKYSSAGNVLSIGRVQTPTLALIVQRQEEIDHFRPEDFWELKTIYRGVTFNATGGRFKTEAEANKALAAIEGSIFTVNDVNDKKGREAPPRLFDLTSLQVECNKKWGWSADDTLQRIQSLYEKKVTTYPRVDTTYLPEDIYPKIPVILKQMSPYAGLTAKILGSRIPKSKKVFDNAKVTDHHAIIPTGQSPSVLAGEERKLYHLIALRFIAAFYPDCTFKQTTVTGEASKTGFKATGKVISDPGWRTVYQGERNEESTDAAAGVSDDETDDRVLPPFTPGESGPHTPSMQKRQTQPPKPYTEGTLLRAMESAGKTVDDEALREAMKENGIGRPSTRAAIIETLFKRHYIMRMRKNIIPTQAGKDLIATINEELLKSAKLTGLWENKLRRIERGEFSPQEFVNELKEQIRYIVINVLSDNTSRHIDIDSVKKTSAPQKTVNKESSAADTADRPKRKRQAPIKSLDQIKCPLCGEGHILKGHSAYGCSNYTSGCKFRLDFQTCDSSLSASKVAAFIKKHVK